MSDLYDSLEDEKGEIEGGEESDDEFIDRYSIADSLDLSCGFVRGQSQRSRFREKGIFPKIPNDVGRRKAGKMSNTVNKEILDQQGLQINDDGSFSRSPRIEQEHLPFVTREYQNLIFQKRQTYQSKDSAKKKNQRRRNSESETFVPPKVREERKIRGRSLSCSNGGRIRKDIMSQNLTDAMKRKLLERHMENSPGNRLDDRVRKVKPIINFLESQMSPLEDSSATRRSLLYESDSTKLPLVCTKALRDGSASSNLEAKSSRSKVVNDQLDASLLTTKLQLSYLERHQKEMGYNPLYLRPNHGKYLSDTTRSTYGDSNPGELSGVSSRALSSRKFRGDEDEELFYQRLIEKDRKQRLAQKSTRSEDRLKTKKLIDLVVSNSCKDQKEHKYPKKNNLSRKSGEKLTAIDIASAEIDPLSCFPKKNCHYCALDSNASLTKAELALKARAYGFMVNARNVFRLKNQSIASANGKTDKSKNKIVRGPRSEPEKKYPVECAGNSPNKKTRPSDSIPLKNSTSSLTKFSDALAEPGNDENKRKSTFSFYPSSADDDFSTEILHQMKYCLDKDVSFENFGHPKNMGARSDQTLDRTRTKY